eukprot:NODE_2737_length_1001_cov_370.804348_g2717_i0.p1 GENE.NODE_2737_length_1001_cov_370.804348_g2717_i0~~NODE_2737_length_1001_cov_370.804348_g2717_i0.p1  ORF type:complete len:263 (+),score=37.61 NODE_2737_length_1001_cov_370.804348_g2717_i0:88-876(+)
MLAQQIRAKIASHKADVTLSPVQGDGYLRFGDTVMLQNAHSEGFLSVDLDDSFPTPGGPKFIVTTAPAQKPMTRNTWTVEHIASADDEFYASRGEGNVVHYSQKFRLVLNSKLGDTKLSLQTQPTTATDYSKVSKKQEVSVKARGTFEFVWECLYADTEYRMEMEGTPVKANQLVMLHHCQTNTPLASDKEKKYINDFGAECEVCCHKWPTSKTKLAATSGPELPQNRWAFITAPPAADGADPAAEISGANASVRFTDPLEQ